MNRECKEQCEAMPDIQSDSNNRTIDKEQSLLYVCHASLRKSRKKLILGYQAELWK